ncbi:MAG: exodeoxyribonuclease VII small subunit [Bacillota bacterium]
MAEESLSFETALERLEQAVRALESGELPLEEALERFQKGVELVRVCREKLEAAEKMIAVLVQGSTGLTLEKLDNREGGD